MSTISAIVSKDQAPSGDYLADVSPRHTVWDKRKAAADVVADVYALAADGSIAKHAQTVGQCSDDLILSEFVATTGESSYKASSRKCRGRHCPICQSARARKLTEAFTAALPLIMAHCPGGRWLFLTLTVRNCPITELRRTLHEMGRAWQRLIERRELRFIKGWVRSVEVTRGQDGPMQAHPHCHVLLLVLPGYFRGKSYIKQARWIELWRDCARLDYDPVVHIRRVDTVKGGLEEAVKAATYSVKPEELQECPEWFHEFHAQVRSLRFLATGGVVKQVLSGQSDLAGDIADPPASDVSGEATGQQLLFGWDRPDQHYRCRR